MINYLFRLGIKAKKALQNSINSKKKNRVLKDYVNLILRNQLKIISQNQRYKKSKKRSIK